jgi:DNA-binding NarL/FixJ family response regulator
LGVVRVLLVDDEVAFVRAVTGVIEETPGFEIAGVAGSGEQALELAATLVPDLVLMDINLPGIDGLEATRRLRDGSRFSPVVFLLSTYEEDAGDGFVAESGAAAYVPKETLGPDRLVDLWSRVAR